MKNSIYFPDNNLNDLEKLNRFGLRDKIDQGSGLSQSSPENASYTSIEHTLVVDSRDCIGTTSLADAKTYFTFNGGRGAIYGNVVSTSISGTYPTVVTLNTVVGIKDGDTLLIKGVRGNTNVNGVYIVSNVLSGPNTVQINCSSNGNYSGSGSWVREADPGYPKITDKDSTIVGNTITVNLEDELKFLRSMTLFHIVIPRDIIPLAYTLSDFITSSVGINNITYPGIVINNYTTLIPQEASYMEKRMLGFYSSPIDLWRTYNGAAFSFPNQVTPPPLNLWNPPIGAWPLQPIPYPFQTVPTYKSNLFTINTVLNNYIILSGYGVYDLVDWTINTGNPITDAFRTGIIRKLLLILICPIQSYNNFDYVDLILNCKTTSNLDPALAYGFGDFQRYIPGPGLQLNYQPNTNSTYTAFVGSGPPNVPQIDSIVPFPNFNGNVWGPYNAPGDRFQKMGLRDTLQDLYLNGDLNNLFGTPIISPNVPSEGISIDPSFGLNFSSQIAVNMANFTSSTNPNITNAMRISPNGFGASVVRAEGNGTLYTSNYNSAGLGAGGIGPSPLGVPSSWVDHGVYTNGTYTDPTSQGPAGPNSTPLTSDASYTGLPIIGKYYRTSYNDSGPNGGSFIPGVQNYINYTVNDIPDTDLIIRIHEAKRDENCQSTRSLNRDALLDVPIRLNLGSTSGTFQYIESLQSLLAQATAYWEKRFFNAKSSISRLHISFTDYAGNPIPLEKMLQTRGVSESLNRFVRFNEKFDIDWISSDLTKFSFLFDPLNPQLIGRMKRYLQIIFKVTAYQGMPPGLEPNSMLSNASSNDFDHRDFS